MIAILELINNPQKMRRYLFWYLIIMPLALFAWILLGAANSGLDFKAAINIPFYAVAFLNGCLSILFAGLLKFAASENEHTERMITFYTLVMLVFAGNLPGALLAFFLWWALREAPEEPFAPNYRWVFIASMVFLGLVTLLVLFANIRLWSA
ncbi:cell shape determination protein CcmA [Rothia dentocariosa]|uniref:cell shape determination protein CcmA n=1 Tax=Rothia dentocariosa TaxID=2047 RepID=UPI0039A28B30